MPNGHRELPALGPRGEGWVLLQALVLALVFGAGLLGPTWPDRWNSWARACAIASAVLAVPLFVGGSLRLGRQLTPFPKPVEGGSLRQDGVYRLARHPIYGGALLLALAWSLATGPIALVPTALLALLFEGKRHREESWLAERHPGYEEYRRRVRRRFIPFVW